MNEILTFSTYIFLLLLLVLAILIVLVVASRQNPPFWDKLYQSWGGLSQFAKHLLLAVGLVISVFVIAYGSGLFAKGQAKTWLCEYDPETYPDCSALMAASLSSAPSAPAPTPVSGSPSASPTIAQEQASASPSPGPSVSPTATPTPTPTPSPGATPIPLADEQKARLAAQESRVKGLARHHASVMAFFAQAYYSAICVLLCGGGILAIAMFFVATKGWGSTNQYVKTIFVVMTVVIAFFGLWPPVFQHEKNLSDNKALFLEYQTLRNEIRSYPVTGTNVKNEVKAPNNFITYVDSELARLGNVAVGFDYTKITYKGAFESSKSNAPTPTPTPTPPKSTPTKTP